MSADRATTNRPDAETVDASRTKEVRIGEMFLSLTSRDSDACCRMLGWFDWGSLRPEEAITLLWLAVHREGDVRALIPPLLEQVLNSELQDSLSPHVDEYVRAIVSRLLLDTDAAVRERTIRLRARLKSILTEWPTRRHNHPAVDYDLHAVQSEDGSVMYSLSCRGLDAARQAALDLFLDGGMEPMSVNSPLGGRDLGDLAHDAAIPPTPTEGTTTLYISPSAFLRSMLVIAKTCFQHPFSTTTVDLTTGELVSS